MCAVLLPGVYGYSTTWFQLSRWSCVVAEAPEEKPSGGAGITMSRRASSVLVPSGTVSWMEYISTRSRRHVSRCPLAENCSPVRSTMGPVGPCSPGIHLGKTRVSDPGATGICSVACKIFSGACDASTCSLIGCPDADVAGAAGFPFCAKPLVALISRHTITATKVFRFNSIVISFVFSAESRQLSAPGFQITQLPNYSITKCSRITQSPDEPLFSAGSRQA